MSGNSSDGVPAVGRCAEIERDHPEVSDPLSKAGLILPILFYIYTYGGFMLYWLKRRHSKTLLQRRNLPLMAISISGMSWYCNIYFREFIGRNDYPCVIYNSSSIVFSLFIAWPFIVRVILFYNKIVLNRLVAEKIFADKIRDPFTQKTNIRPLSKRRNKMSEFLAAATLKRFEPSRESTVPPAIKKRLLLSSTRFGLLLVLLPGLTLFVVYLVAQRHLIGCRGCRALNIYFYALISFLGIVMVAISLYVFRKFRHEPDPLGIKSELSRILVIVLGACILWGFFSFFDPGDLEDQGLMYWNFIILFSLFPVVTIMYWPAVKESLKQEANKRDDYNNLASLLQSETGRQLFKAHMASELCIENYYFWREATSWKEEFVQNGNTTTASFRSIVDSFILPDSLLRINVSGDLYAPIQEIYQGDMDLEQSIFDECIREVFMLMVNNSWPRFQQSHLYRKGVLHNGSVVDPDDILTEIRFSNDL